MNHVSEVLERQGHSVESGNAELFIDGALKIVQQADVTPCNRIRRTSKLKLLTLEKMLRQQLNGNERKVAFKSRKRSRKTDTL